jgi:hypothetical protein
VNGEICSANLETREEDLVECFTAMEKALLMEMQKQTIEATVQNGLEKEESNAAMWRAPVLVGPKRAPG